MWIFKKVKQFISKVKQFLKKRNCLEKFNKTEKIEKVAMRIRMMFVKLQKKWNELQE